MLGIFLKYNVLDDYYICIGDKVYLNWNWMMNIGLVFFWSDNKIWKIDIKF